MAARDPDKPTLSERFTRAVIKAETAERVVDEGPTTVEEIKEAVKRADDKERLIGLVAAPLAGVVGLLVTGSLLANDPKSYSSVYRVLTLSLLVLALVILASAWFRKRLYLGIAMALFGLSIFNLHFWGFGVPFLLFGAWYLVRAYRLQQKLKLAEQADPGGRGPTRASKRYTPPVNEPGKLPRPRRGDDQQAG
jgi:hypothetical protein